MLRQVAIEHEADDFGDLPLDFAQWEIALSAGVARLYKKLRDPWCDGKTITLKVIGEAIGLSKTRVESGFSILEANGFVRLDERDDELRLIVLDVPDPQEGIEEAVAHIGQMFEDTENHSIDAFIGYWNELHHKYLMRPYMQTAPAKDKALVRKLVKLTSLREMKRVARFYWLNRNDEDPKEIGYFYTQYNDLSSDMTEFERRSM